MNKIIEVALTSKFGAEAVPSLMEVISATPNDVMAAKILLGVYEQPKLPNTVFNEQGLEKTLDGVDYWRITVFYSYQEEVRRHMYVDKDTDTSLITVDNYMEYDKDYGVSNTKSFYLPTGEIKTRQSNCSIEDWLSQDAQVVA
jgi:hypothetical protein